MNMHSVRQFFTQMAKSAARVFSPAQSDLTPVGFQPITDDVYRCHGSTCYASDLDPQNPGHFEG